MKILQRDLNRSTFIVWEMKKNVSVVKLCLYVSECVCSKIIKELPGLVGSGTPCIISTERDMCVFSFFLNLFRCSFVSFFVLFFCLYNFFKIQLYFLFSFFFF